MTSQISNPIILRFHSAHFVAFQSKDSQTISLQQVEDSPVSTMVILSSAATGASLIRMLKSQLVDMCTP